MSYKIRAIDTGLFVSKEGFDGSPVILTKGSDELQFSRPLAPGVSATIKGNNGLYINLGPPRVGYLVWSQEPREWKFEFTFRGIEISTVYDGVETLRWSLRGPEDDKIYLNPYEASFFDVQ